MLSLIAVEPRKSENHSTALIRLGDAARNPPAQYLLGGVAAEIDPADRPRDVPYCWADLIASPSTGNQIAQRGPAPVC